MDLITFFIILQIMLFIVPCNATQQNSVTTREQAISKTVISLSDAADKQLLQAIANNNPQEVEKALKAGADVNRRLQDELNRTILITSCMISCRPVNAPDCMHCCSDPDAAWRPEYDTRCENRRSIIKLLLQAGARVNDCDEQGTTALHMACIADDIDMLQLLIAAGATVDVKDLALADSDQVEKLLRVTYEKST